VEERLLAVKGRKPASSCYPGRISEQEELKVLLVTWPRQRA
jgi:hypothetical protein